MKIYLDSCCFNRPFDDLSQSRVLLEALAIIAILKNSLINDDIIIGSQIIFMELQRIRDNTKKNKLLRLFRFVDHIINYNEEIAKYSAALQTLSGIKLYDSLHIASAEYGRVDVFLTTDDKLIKQCKNLPLSFHVTNPLHYIVGSN